MGFFSKNNGMLYDSPLDKYPQRTDLPPQRPLSDFIVDRNEKMNRIEENRRNGVACCPKCGSASLSANQKGYGIGKGIIGAAVTGLPIGLVAGNIGRHKITVTCLNCGHRWKP